MSDDLARPTGHQWSVVVVARTDLTIGTIRGIDRVRALLNEALPQTPLPAVPLWSLLVVKRERTELRLATARRVRAHVPDHAVVPAVNRDPHTRVVARIAPDLLTLGWLTILE